jgi:GNAT superfamily N-acetyltransferase
MPASLSIPPAAEADYPELAAAGRAAFQADKTRYGEGPSIYENPSFLLPLLAGGGGVVRRMVADGQTVGVIITFATGPDTRRLGCLCLPPEEQGKGYGTQAIRLLEAAYPDTKVWTLDTPADSARNRHFYEKNGYRIVGEADNETGPKLVLFEKRL